MSAEELKRFYKAKAKKPELYGYDDTGNLIELNKEGAVIKTIPLPQYRAPTDEEYDEMEKKRMEAIEVANKEYENARRELREVSANPETTDSEILRINRKVVEADIKLQAVRFPLKTIDDAFGIPINKIDFNQPNEKRKYPYLFYFLQERPFTLQEQYVRIGKAPEKPLISVAEARAAEDNAVTVILFSEPDTNDYGFLSLKWTVEIEFNGTMYNSAYQAIAAEIAKSFNDQNNLQKIMIAETPDEVSYTLADVPGDAEVNETKWNDLTRQLIYDVNIAKFNQYPELTARLLETKNASLGAYIPGDNLIGIGLSIDNIQAQNPINWTGQNLLGKALMDIRQKIRTDQEVAAQAAAQVAQPQPVPRKRAPKSAIATSTTEVTTPSDSASAPVPRPIRRRPKVSMAEPIATGESATTGESVIGENPVMQE